MSSRSDIEIFHGGRTVLTGSPSMLPDVIHDPPFDPGGQDVGDPLAGSPWISESYGEVFPVLFRRGGCPPSERAGLPSGAGLDFL